MAKCCENTAKFDGISDDYKRRLWIVIAFVSFHPNQATRFRVNQAI